MLRAISDLVVPESGIGVHLKGVEWSLSTIASILGVGLPMLLAFLVTTAFVRFGAVVIALARFWAVFLFVE